MSNNQLDAFYQFEDEDDNNEELNKQRKSSEFNQAEMFDFDSEEFEETFFNKRKIFLQKLKDNRKPIIYTSALCILLLIISIVAIFFFFGVVEGDEDSDTDYNNNQPNSTNTVDDIWLTNTYTISFTNMSNIADRTNFITQYYNYLNSLTLLNFTLQNGEENSKFIYTLNVNGDERCKTQNLFADVETVIQGDYEDLVTLNIVNDNKNLETAVSQPFFPASIYSDHSFQSISDGVEYDTDDVITAKNQVTNRRLSSCYHISISENITTCGDLLKVFPDLFPSLQTSEYSNKVTPQNATFLWQYTNYGFFYLNNTNAKNGNTINDNDYYGVISTFKFYYQNMEQAINGDLEDPIHANWRFVVFNPTPGPYSTWDSYDLDIIYVIYQSMLLWSKKYDY